MDDHFDKVVVPSFRAFLAASTALVAAVEAKDSTKLDEARDEAMRMSRTAAIEVHHFEDVIWDAKPTWLPAHLSGTSALRAWAQSTWCKMLRGQSNTDLDLLADIADAFKHAQLTQARKVPRRVTSAKATVTLETGYGKLIFGEGNYGGMEQVVVTLNDGSQRALSSILQNVMDVYRQALSRTLPAMGE